MTKNKFTLKQTRFGKPSDGEKAQENPSETKKTAENKTVEPERKNAETAYENADNEAVYEEADAQREQYLNERMEFTAQKALFNEELPVSFAAFLCGKTEEDTLENIHAFKEEFQKAVEEAVSEKIKGITPRTNSAMAEYDPFLSGLGC